MLIYFFIFLSLIFYISLFFILHTYFFYPLSLKFLNIFFRRPHYFPEKLPLESLPNVGIIVPAYNEEKVIFDKITNLLAIDYPQKKYTIYICSDCSSDNTVEIAKSFTNIVVFDYQTRQGKTGVINQTVPRLHHDIILITDADGLINPDALQKIVRHYTDSSIGSVSGALEVISSNQTKSESIYRGFETFQKGLESKIHSIIGVNGCINSFRHSLFKPIHPQTIVEDMVIPLGIIQSGYRVIYEPDAVFRTVSINTQNEFRRRIRIGTGNFQTIALTKNMLSPKYGFVSYSYWSHKIFRWLTPFFMALCLISNLLLLWSNSYLFLFTFSLQTVFYSLVLVGFFLRHSQSSSLVIKLFLLSYNFFSMNTALIIGFFRFLSSDLNSTWQPTQRHL
jgi:poly-beta-1,6-N-acetyl-D-glucosamine synthase